MPLYVKKRFPIKAEVYERGMEDGFEKIFDERSNHPVKPYINTHQGKAFIDEDDYVITGLDGERYPCKPHVFESTYELYEE